MIYNAEVQGSQPAVLDFEINAETVYARAGIERMTRTEDDREESFWSYSEVQMSRTEYQRMLALDSGFVSEWTEAARVAERRARYERMDPIVSALRRRIDLGKDVEENTSKLKAVQEYLDAVHETIRQATYPEAVEYPDEPTV